MQFNINQWLEVLKNTPEVVFAMLHNLSEEWISQNEGENTWTAKEVLAHLVLCEETNWLLRARIILSDNRDKTFDLIDMTAHLEIARNQSLQELLHKFRELRKTGVEELKSYHLQEQDFLKTAIHPVTGEVNLQQVISTWLTHDMTHIAQIARIIAIQNKDLVGSFKQYLSILNK